jgi:hypothetical protein
MLLILLILFIYKKKRFLNGCRGIVEKNNMNKIESLDPMCLEALKKMRKFLTASSTDLPSVFQMLNKGDNKIQFAAFIAHLETW